MQHPDLPAQPVPPQAGEESGPPTGFTDVFISYSRKDKEFVQYLSAALKETKREVWVDWHDILPSEDFLQAIYAGIDAASTFVFVMSPDSLSSQVCQKEVMRAVEGKKRIIPVVCREVNAQAVFEPLQPLNWIDFSRKSMFPVAFKQLIFALETDLDYWHLSARLLARARRWETKPERSLTLRGKELREAERWQCEGVTKKPPPGPPVTTFIAASVKQRTRSTVLSSILTFIFLVTAGVGGYFVLNYHPPLNPNLVSNLNDTGPGSLRLDVTDAKQGSTITFAPDLRGSITLRQSLSISRDVTIVGPGADKVSITNDKYAVIVAAKSTATISGLAFHVQIENSGKLTLSKSIVSGVIVPPDKSGNLAHGGGILNSGTLTLSESTISSNDVVSGDGGGIYNDGGTLIISNSTISSNTVEGEGGGIDNENNGTLIISNSTIAGNAANDGILGGGGIDNSNGTVTISNSTISDNTTTDGGGGINNLTGILIVSNSTISGNTADFEGGAIDNSGALTLVNSTLFGNSAATKGGGIYSSYVASGLTDQTPTTANIVFSTIYGNKAANGAGMSAAEFSDPLADNEVPPVHVQVQVRNSIVVGNQSDSGPDITGTLTTEGYNLFQHLATSALLFADPDHKHATDKAVTDLSFISSNLQNSKGPNGKPAFTQTLALINISGNPAIDAIPPGDDCKITITITDSVTGNPVVDPTTHKPLTITTDHDQRGVARPYGSGCDSGAYEYSGA